MARETSPFRQPTFSAGELSPRVLGRTDIAQYRQGLAEMENWVVAPTGPVTRRPGFKYIGTCKAVTFPQASAVASATGVIDLNAVCFAAELGLYGRWVAVGDDAGADSMIVTCDADANGRPSTWTAVAGGSIPDDETLFGIAWSGSLFVAVGATNGATESTIYTSPDGLVWTSHSAIFTGTPQLENVIWNSGVALFVAVGRTNSIVITSPDGINWTERLAGTTNNQASALASNPSGSIMVIAGTMEVYRSTDGGLNWSADTPPATFGNARNAFYDEGYFYVVGTDASGSSHAYIMRSTGGGTWTAVLDESANGYEMANGARIGLYLLVVGESGQVRISTDGTTWTSTTIGTISLNGIAVSSSYAVIVGDDDGATDAQLYTIPLDTSKRRKEKFIGSTGSPYLLEIGHLYMRFYRDEARMDSTPGTAYEVTTPWDANDVADLQVAQAQDVMYITHKNYPPRRLTRTSETTFTLDNLMDTTTITSNIASSTYRLWDGPYLDENSTVTTMTLSSITPGSVTLTASVATFTVSTDIGRAVRVRCGGTTWGWGIITATASTTSATLYLVEAPSAVNATTRWALGSFSNTTGFPRCVSFFQQRLVYGFTRTQPQTLWMSVTASFNEFDPTQFDDTVVDDNGVFITLATEDASHVRWIKALRQLNIGTSAGVYQLKGDANSNAVTPSFISVDLASQWKVEDGAIPDNIGDTLFYVQQSGRIVRGVSPGAGGQAELQPNVTLLADHVTATGVKQLEYASVPHSILWGRRTDGLLIGCTINPEERTLGWHRHPLAGSLSDADWPAVLSMAVMPVSGQDQLYVATRRTINGAQVEYIEALQLPYDSLEMDQEDACYLDCAVKYDGVSTSTITGLDHLEGQSVTAWADGLPQGPFTVASGAITLTTAASVVWVGLDYSAISDGKIMPVKIPNDEGEKVRVVSTLIDILDTVNLKIGQTTDAADFFSIQGMDSTLTTAGTTDVRMVHPGRASTRFQLIFRPVGAAPATITGFTHQFEFSQP